MLIGSPQAYTLEYAPDATAEERAAVLDGLRAFNLRFVPEPQFAPMVVLLRDSSGIIAGGLVGETGWQWLHIYWLWVEDVARGRGFGRQLLAMAEREATRRQCVASWLDTFEFQARGFYEGIGYEVFGEIPDYPAGYAR